MPVCVRIGLIGAVLLLALAAIVPVRVEAQTAHSPAGPQSAQYLPSEREFALGLALMAAGRPRDAAAVFAAILSRNPNLDRVRLELARAYFLSRQWGRARSEFLSVLSGDIPESARATVLRLLREIDARRGFDWDADLAIARLGDTRNYESDTIFVNFGGAARPFRLDGRDGETALGLRYAFSAALNQNIPRLSRSRVQTLGFGRITVAGDEGPGARFDDLTLTGEVGARFIWPRAALRLAPTLSRRFIAGSALEDLKGLRATFQNRTRKGAAFTLSGVWQKVDRLGSDRRDGHVARISFTASRPITPRTTLGASVLIEDRDAASPVDDYRRTRLTGFGAFDVGRGITLRPSLYLERKKVDRRGPAVADETGKGAALTVESNRIILGNGFTPYARFEFAQVKSDIKAFSYRESFVSVGFERQF